MRKKLLVLGAFVSVVMLVSCTGSKKEAVTYTPEEIADAGQVVKYYDTSLALLKNLDERERCKCGSGVYGTAG